MSRRVLIVSNRLPVTIASAGGKPIVEPSAGGLATGLHRVHARSDGWWIGWPGATEGFSEAQRAGIDAALRERRLLPVHLSDREVGAFYRGFSNEVLWPLFHYLLDRVRLEAQQEFDVYRDVNEKMADAVADAIRPGDLIWIHDYQFMLLPAMLRRRVPEARIGFFLHIPFPSSEVFRILPWRRQILEGVLGADLVGFHAFSYLRHFAASALRILGIEGDIDRLDHDGRIVRLGVHPMSIDAREFERLAASDEVIAELEGLRRQEAGRSILLGIDRLDYTKGLLRRLLALDRLLELEPGLSGRIRLVQVVVPSRAGVGAYEELRRRVEELVGRINGRHATLEWSPIRYLHRPISSVEMAALHRLADVMLVTPLRDGMNLVAKEHVASRIDGDGVLVLSEFAGAADEMGAALSVNPYDIDGTARAILHALTMEPGQRRAAMRTLREQVLTHDVHAWAEGFLDALAGDAIVMEDPPTRATSPSELARLACTRPRLALLLDYDGTLRGHERHPADAAPDDELMDLLSALARDGTIDVHVVSGRRQDDLERWLGSLPLFLHAEHGLFSRWPGGAWQRNVEAPIDWMPRVRQILGRLVASVAGSHVEEKSAGMAWHYRDVEPELGALRARELRLNLAELTANHPVQVVPGKKVVEFRCTGVSKALVAGILAVEAASDTTIVALGDDRTDEDLFRALPADAVTVRVDAQPSAARLRLHGVAEVRAFLRELLRLRAIPRTGNPSPAS